MARWRQKAQFDRPCVDRLDLRRVLDHLLGEREPGNEVLDVDRARHHHGIGKAVIGDRDGNLAEASVRSRWAVACLARDRRGSPRRVSGEGARMTMSASKELAHFAHSCPSHSNELP